MEGLRWTKMEVFTALRKPIKSFTATEGSVKELVHDM